MRLITITLLSCSLSCCDKVPTIKQTVPPLGQPVTKQIENAPTIGVPQSPAFDPIPETVNALPDCFKGAPGEKRIRAVVNHLKQASSSKEICDLIRAADTNLDTSEVSDLTSEIQSIIIGKLSIGEMTALGASIINKQLGFGIYSALSEEMWRQRTPSNAAIAFGLTLPPENSVAIFARFATLSSSTPSERTNSTIQTITGFLASSDAPARDELSKIFGLSIYGLHDANKAVEVGLNLQNNVPVFSSFSKSYMDSWLDYDSIAATEWLVKQDVNWQSFGAVAVVDFLVRKADMESASIWLSKVSPQAKLGQHALFAIGKGLLSRP